MGGRVGGAFELAAVDLLHPVDHDDGQVVRGGHRRGRLLRAGGAGGVDGGDGLGGQPSGQVLGLRATDVVEGHARRPRVERPDDVAFGAAVPGEDEPHAVVPRAQALEPALRGGEPVGVRRPDHRGARRARSPAVGRPRVGAQEAHPVATAVQRGQRLAHRGLADVAEAVEVEPVLGVPVLDRAGLDAGEVDAAHRQLGEQPEQRAGPVLGGGGEGGAVVPGRRGQRPGRAGAARTG